MNTGARSDVLKQLVQRLKAEFTGAETSMLREVVRGPWNPARAMDRRCTVIDQGQKRDDAISETSAAADVATALALRIELLFELPADWQNPDEAGAWTDFLEQVRELVCNWRPDGIDCLGVNYISDDPWEAVLQSGGSRAVWTMDFEIAWVALFEDGEQQ